MGAPEIPVGAGHKLPAPTGATPDATLEGVDPVTELPLEEEFRNTEPDPLRWMLGEEAPEAATFLEAEITVPPEQQAITPDVAVSEPPVYDDRGNVRPRGTAGARPMTYAQRVRIAKRLAAETDDA